MATTPIYFSRENTLMLAEALSKQISSSSDIAHSYAKGLREALEVWSNVGPEVHRIDGNRVKQIFKDGLAQGDIEGVRQVVRKLMCLVYSDFLVGAYFPPVLNQIVIDYL